MKLINLNENVIQALDFFMKNKPPKLDLSRYQLPFVAGSGNAFHTGTILFSGKAAIFADESNFRPLLASYGPIIKQGLIKDAIIISASGEKDSVWEVELARNHKLKTTLLTCEANSSAAKIADKVYVYRKIAEPYTYNVSTYLGMILSASGEKPANIKKLIRGIKLPKEFKKYSAFSFVLPDKFGNICPMLEIKRHELFGPFLSLRAFAEGSARHAKFVIPTPKELVISVGYRNSLFGDPKARWDIKLPSGAGFGTVFALSYWLVGQIQSAKPQYFKNNIAEYRKELEPRMYGKNKPGEVIVPGN